MHARRALPSLLLAFLMGASVLAVHPSAAFPVAPDQATLVKDRFGSGAPFTSWTPVISTNTFFLHSDPTGDDNVAWTPGPDLTGAMIDVQQPPVVAVPPSTAADAQVFDSGNQAAIGCQSADCAVGAQGEAGFNGPARFPVADDLDQVDSMHVYGWSTQVFASCTQATTDPLDLEVFGIHAQLIRQSKVNDEWVDAGTISAMDLYSFGSIQIGTVALMSNSASFGSSVQENGVLVNPGERLLVEYSLPDESSDAGCILYYDRFFDFDGNGDGDTYSQVTVTSDAMRVASFPAGADGHELLGFPSAGNTDSAGRRLHVEALQAHAMGTGMAHQLIDDKHANVRLYSLDEERYLYYVDNSGGGFPREFTTHDVDLVSSRADNLVPEPDVEQHIGGGVIRRSFEFAYPATLPDVKRMEAQFYSFSDSWQARSPQFAIGGKGIQLGLDPSENKTGTHLVNPGEATEFAFRVNNTGTSEDVITVAATDPSGGWTARVLGGGKFFVKPGGSAIGTVEVIPPASGVAGQKALVTLTASSSFADVTNPPSLTLTTQLTDGLVRKLGISTDTDLFEVHPGQTKGYSVAVRNLGTARDALVVVPSFPSNVQGWTVRSNPSSLQVVAGGFAEVQVLLTPPASAPTDTSFPLGLTVSEVGNPAVSNRTDVTVQVVSVDGVLALLYDEGVNRTLRLQGAPVCNGSVACPDGAPVGNAIIDTAFDRSGLFRVLVQNQGDRAQEFRVDAFWDKTGGGFTDSNDCEYGTRVGTAPGGPSVTAPLTHTLVDGVPDGWRFNYFAGIGDNSAPGATSIPPARNAAPPLGSEMAPYRQRGIQSFTSSSSSSGFSGYVQLNATDNPLVLAPHSSREVYFELGYIDGADACRNNSVRGTVGGQTGSSPDPVDAFSPKATLGVRVMSLDDPAIVSSAKLAAVRTAAGTFQSGGYPNTVHAVDIEAAVGQATTVATTRTNAARFDLVAANRGNERDNLRIAVSGGGNWVHQIVVDKRVPAANCDNPTNDGTNVACTGLGVYDEVRFHVLATAKDTVPIGERDPITVTVFSGRSPGIFDTQALTARAAGTLAFSAQVLANTTRAVPAGQSVSFPIEISNEGTADDSYRVTLTSVSDAAWKPVVSTSSPLFVPAGHDVPAFLTLTAPASTPAGKQVMATIQVESTSSPARQVLQVIAVSTSAGSLTLAGADGQDVLVSARGTPEEVTVVATKLQGAAGDKITFRVDRDSLPATWKVDDGESDADREIVRTMAVTQGSTLPRATATFKVIAPAEALGTARALLHIEATTNTTLKAATDIALDLASTQGVGLSLEDNSTQVIAPGGPAHYNLTVHNLGLGQDTVTLTSSQLPAGWTLVLNPPGATLGPLEDLDLAATLSAPVAAKPGDEATVVLFAASAVDPGQVASQVLRAQVGYNDITLEALDGEPYGAPQETVTRVVNVTNTGTLPDQVQLRSVIDTIGVRTSVNATVSPALVSLKPGQTQQVSFNLRLGGDVPSDSAVQATASALSLLDARPEGQRANASAALLYHVLPYVTLDTNGDRIAEYAVDRDRDAGNGFEEFRSNTIPGGRPLTEPDLSRFLRDDARASFERDVTLANGTVQRMLVYTIDGDGDGKVDHFLDADRDGQPDFYWDPDANKASPIEFRKDVNGDQVPESFVDTDGDGKLDATFDLTRGTFTKVLQTDVDGDGKLDYVVDKDGDGQVDQDETVLYTRTGGLLIVQKVDVDGDGKLDQVFDTNGDGNPDYFIPNGSTESVPITMRDVNGDGVMDWTFDGDNDGRKESYYDPATGEAHTIDAAGHFVDALKEYWYIGALFAVVVVLFVALVLVTRR